MEVVKNVTNCVRERMKPIQKEMESGGKQQEDTDKRYGGETTEVSPPSQRCKCIMLECKRHEALGLRGQVGGTWQDCK